MISLKIIDVKDFMSKFLISNVFDNFLLTELDISTFTHFHIDGRLNKEFYSNDELEILGERKYPKWSEIKPFAFSIIKGSKLPIFIKTVFALSSENIEKVIQKSGIQMKEEEINGLFINIKYEKENLYIITGTSIKTFTLDKTLDQVWDGYVKDFLRHYEIAVEDA
ncbi:DUF5721 family protein [Anaerocolumna sp.]|uniref:DUF5721 family protein n=1 Tax=Anaerocolumna sp. TaxID=2041569 RepID=UPI0028ABB195|nr:DUF5721 family protein [Anaerocolumna sp.]